MADDRPEPETGPEAPSTLGLPPLTSGSIVLTGLFWSGLAHLLPQIYALAQSIVAARILGPEGMGHQSFIAWAQISLTMLFSGGLPIALARFVGESVGARRAGAAAHLLRWGWRIEVGGALAGAGVLIAIATGRGDLQSAWTLAGLACAMSILHTVPNSVLIGLQRFKEASMVGLALGAAGTIAVITVLTLGGGIVGMFVVEVVVSSLAMAWAGYLAHRSVAADKDRGTNFKELDRRVLRYAGLASIRVLFALIVWRRSEVFFLERYSSVSEIAFYSVAFAVFAALSGVPNALLATLFPAFSTLYGAGDIARIRSAFGRSLRLLIVVTLPVFTAAVIAGPRALSFLYGGDYERTGDVLVILLCGFPFFVLFKLGGALLQGMNLLPKMFPVDLAALTVDFALAITLIPHHGAIGAAWANASAQVVAAVLLLWIALRHIGKVRWHLPVLLRTVVACGAMTAPMLLGLQVAGSFGLILSALGGIAGYFLLAPRLGVIPAGDVTWLWESVGNRFGGAVGKMARLLGEKEHHR
ncbi:MAG: polysaccharide biosynthesis C-terminal domain-containing protein [Actinomycetota bacterium]|nr:polysaccharide biosynthesis C-terminal domain-containing protein [Actinomycetota bacterium]